MTFSVYTVIFLILESTALQVIAYKIPLATPRVVVFLEVSYSTNDGLF